jgi:hypothetical protein
VPQPVRRLPQVSVAHDIITIEDATRLVAAQFHRHAFGDAGAHHVPDGRSAKVVRDAAGTAGGDPGAAPRVVEAAGRDRMAGPESDVAGFGWHVMEEEAFGASDDETHVEPEARVSRLDSA